MAAFSLNDALGRAGIAARFDPGIEGQLLTQCRGLLTALANSVPGDAPVPAARAEAHLFESLRYTFDHLAALEPNLLAVGTQVPRRAFVKNALAAALFRSRARARYEPIASNDESIARVDTMLVANQAPPGAAGGVPGLAPPAAAPPIVAAGAPLAAAAPLPAAAPVPLPVGWGRRHRWRQVLWLAEESGSRRP